MKMYRDLDFELEGKIKKIVLDQQYKEGVNTAVVRDVIKQLQWLINDLNKRIQEEGIK